MHKVEGVVWSWTVVKFFIAENKVRSCRQLRAKVLPDRNPKFYIRGKVRKNEE